MSRTFCVQFLVLLFLLSVTFMRAAGAREGAPLDLGEVVITANRAPTPRDQAARHVTVLTRADIEALPAHSVAELLEYAAGVDVAQRGPGVQADLHLGGGGFEQTAVLINGVRVNDPQTGHHNTDLPVTIDAIERIEILHGQGSALYGPDAMGGVIHIVTRTAQPTPRARARMAGGTNATRAFEFGAQSGATQFSAERNASAGYRPGTDSNVTTLFLNQDVAGARLTAGYQDKLFGAAGFYVPGWLSREHTRTQYVNLHAERAAGPGVFAADAYVKTHRDRFDCSVENPALCSNFHASRRLGAELTLTRAAADGARRFTAGLVAEHDRIASTNIGRRNHDRGAAFVQAGVRVSRRLSLDAGLLADRYQGYRAQWAPSLAASCTAAPDTTLHAAWGRSFRAPTYTELFYSDPAHVSTGVLQPETATSYEFGARVHAHGVTLDATLFTRRTYNFIDWRRATPADPWLIGNHGPARFRGVSTELSWDAGARTAWTLSHDALGIALPAGAEYKYTNTRPRHILRLGLRRTLPRGAADVRVRYQKPRAGAVVTLVDAAWRGRIRAATWTLDVNNVFDRSYEDIPGAPMPGRSVLLGLEWNSRP